MFDALEWLAAMCSHVSNKASRWPAIMGTAAMCRAENGKKSDADDQISCILELELTDEAFRRDTAHNLKFSLISLAKRNFLSKNV